MTQDSGAEGTLKPAIGLPTPRWGLAVAFAGYGIAIAANIFVVSAALTIDRTFILGAGGLVLSSAALWVGFVGTPCWATRTRGSGSLRVDFGLEQRWWDALVGLPIGAATQLLLVPLVYLPLQSAIDEDALSAPARDVISRGSGIGLVAIVLTVGVGAPIAEELFFRGLFQTAAIRRFGQMGGVVFVAAFFAATHLQPLLFPGLLVAGLVFGTLAYRFARLGPAIWAHVGFNLTTAVALIASG
jgi:membrane protease YdiL (CAAX protease family)